MILKALSIKNIMLCAFFLVFFTGTARAALLTIDFPSTNATSTASGGGEYFFNPGHSINEVFTGTGVNAATSLDLNLGLDFNALNNGAFVNFDVTLNSVSIGSITLDEFDSVGLYNYSFSFSEIIGAGTYNLGLQVTNTVPGGDGSVGFGEVSTVPVPAAIWLFGSGLIGLVGLARRKKA